MKSDKYIIKFIIRTSCFFLLFFGTVGLFNYLVDPYGVLRSHENVHRAVGMNNHFVKMSHILSHKDKYDSFVMGASTAGKIDVRKIPGGRYYSLTYSLGVPLEFLQDLKLLINKGVNVRNVIIGLEDISYIEDPELHLKKLKSYPYQRNFLKNTMYLLKNMFLLHDLNLYRETLLNKEYSKNGFKYKTLYDIKNTGLIFAPGLDEYIKSDSANYIQSDIFKTPRILNRPPRIEETIKEIDEICRITRSHNINLIFYISPIHHVTYLSINQKKLFQFKRELARVTDYFDFSGLNSITTNNFYYYETSHFRFCVGNWMINRMFGSGPVPEGFGVYVTEKNIDEHLNNLRLQLKNAGYEL